MNEMGFFSFLIFQGDSVVYIENIAGNFCCLFVEAIGLSKLKRGKLKLGHLIKRVACVNQIKSQCSGF